jgi:hypothetical protein
MAFYAQSGYTITVSSTSEGSANNVKDGNSTTYWQTGTLPATLTVDLGSAQTVATLTWLPRQNTGTFGLPLGYEVYVSDDGSFTDFPTAVTTGTWASDLTTKEVSWVAASHRYVRVKVTSGNNGHCTCAEIFIGDGVTTMRESQVVSYAANENTDVALRESHIVGYVGADLNPPDRVSHIVAYVAVPTDEYELEFIQQPLVCIVC